MSCSCKCGCDNRYIGGYRCYPLIVEISHKIVIDYNCMAFHKNHYSTPSVGISGTKNCYYVYHSTKDSGGRRTSTYVFAIASSSESGCKHGDEHKDAVVEFNVTPPLRGWHNKGDGNDEYGPYTKYDSTNPECCYKCTARMKSQSDSDEFFFEPFSNPYPSEHIGGQSEMKTTLVVEVSDDDVSVRFRRA